MIAFVIAWWPRILGYDPLWYHIIIYYVCPIVLIFITIRRMKANREGFKMSEDMIDAQLRGRRPGETKSVPPMPFMPPQDDEDHKK